MSRTTQLGKVFLLVALLIVGSEAKPLRGRKGAFGMGLVGGALAGAMIGHAVAKAPGSAKTAAAPAAPSVAQVVETGVPDANGCYKQTIKEPIAGKPKLYTETISFVCPNQLPAAPAAPQPAVQIVPAVQAPVIVQHVVAPSVVANNTHGANATQAVPVPVPVSAAVPAAVPGPAAVRPSGLTILYATAPVAGTQPPAAVGTAQVFLLSKTVKKQRSAASSLNISHGLLILVVFYCLIRR